MRRTSILFFAFCFLLSCKKDSKSPSIADGFLNNVKIYLKDSLSTNDFSSLDFTRSILTISDSGRTHLLRVPFANESLATDFVLLKANAWGVCSKGMIINLKKEAITDNNHVYDGVINISSLNRRFHIISPIVKGFITAFHNDSSTFRVTSFPESVLPEVVVTCYIHTDDSGISYWDAMNLMSMFNDSNDGGATGEYSYLGGGGSTGGGNGDGGVTGGGIPSSLGVGQEDILIDKTTQIDFEYGENKTAIDIQKYLKCFSNIPDNGATCSIEILSDIPVDKDPSTFFNWQTLSPGHTFLQIKKTNSSGTDIVQQNIGFYPDQSYKSILTTAPIDGKLVDNGGHEFNASLKMNLNTAQLKTIINKIGSLAPTIKYDIDDYNCTDFALEVFNSVRTTPLVIPKFKIPGANSPSSNTPQGLYQELKGLQQSNSPEASNITIPGVKGWIGDSKGPCN